MIVRPRPPTSAGSAVILAVSGRWHFAIQYEECMFCNQVVCL
jgi:hypothetical protein